MKMFDEYLFPVYYHIKDDGRVLRYSGYNDDWDPSYWDQFRGGLSNSTNNEQSDAPNDAYYSRALFGFVMSLILYFCILCCLVESDRGSATKKDVDRSIIKKRVLPHGQSQYFSDDDRDPDDEEESKSSRCCFCRRKRKQTIAPDRQSAEDIMANYRAKTCHHRRCVRGNSIRADATNNKNRKEQTRGDVSDELVLAEEGSVMNDESILCPICIEPYHIGEQVAWSNSGNCRHVFHYECILPWIVLGNVECPVCREEFWSKQHCSCLPGSYGPFGAVGQSALEMRQCRFCVQHGLVSPTTV